jgi:glycosyltransferase involved in cell wall biosynthesis
MSRPYRVLHVIDSLALGGAQVVLENLLTHADRSRFAPETACLHGRGVFWDRIKGTGWPVHSLSFHRYFPSYVPALLGLALARRYDVVHCHLLASNLIAKPIATFAGVPVRINHDHCNDKVADSRRRAPAADTWANRFSTHVCAVSESTRQFLIQHEGVPEERTTTIHNGIDLAIFQPRPERRAAARARWNLPAEAFVVGGIGRLSYQKNFALFLETAAQVLERHPSARFVIAGTGEDDAALRAQAAQLGLGDRLQFLGFVGDMTALYPALDLLLLTSRYEGLPITILEAMAVGIPIVASRLDGMLEILRDGEDAALVPPGESDAFAARVCELIAQHALARRYADAALAKARAHHSAEGMTRAVEAIYLKYLPARVAKE